MTKINIKIKKIISYIGIFIVILLIISMDTNNGALVSDVTMNDTDDNAVCNFTSTYIPDGTYLNYFDNLPALDGPEDFYGILGIEITCSEKEGCIASMCAENDPMCVDGFIKRRSRAKESDSLPYSLDEIEVLDIETSPDSKAVVTINGKIDSRRGIIEDYDFTGDIVQKGDILRDEDIDRNQSNISIYIKNTNTNQEDFKGSKKLCAFALFAFKTKYSGSIKGKITGTLPGEEEGLENAKVKLSPCPTDERKDQNGNLIQVIPEGNDCEVFTDSEGNYQFDNVLPRRSSYTVSATRDAKN